MKLQCDMLTFHHLSKMGPIRLEQKKDQGNVGTPQYKVHLGPNHSNKRCIYHLRLTGHRTAALMDTWWQARLCFCVNQRSS